MNRAKGNKKAALLKTARELFWKHGFKRISIEEICVKAGISKMTFYRLFANKNELAKAVYDEEVENGLKSFRAILSEDETPQEKIKKILIQKLKGTTNISKDFINDFYANPELGLRDYIEEKTKTIWNETLNDFRQAQQEGLFRKDLNPEFFLNLSSHLTAMLYDEKMLKLYDSPQELILEISNFCIYGIAPHE
ncbi:MAG: TetR/AcrR family transcriptional regulator [Bacteroidota bacterium]|nr:TetR/AcrR family transcriptional regulator [Bacteroidota bacterium]